MHKYPESHHLCAGVSRRRNSVILAQEPWDSVRRKIRRQACVGNEATSSASRGIPLCEIRTSGPALEGSIVSLLLNTMGGLSGGRRGGDVSGAASAPSCLPELWPWIWPVESVALPLSSGRHTPATAPAHPDARAQPCVDCAVPLGVLSALFPSHLRQEPRCFSFEGASWRRAEFPHPFLQPQCCL